jgi:fibronectin-binding autotransporter adhesin
MVESWDPAGTINSGGSGTWDTISTNWDLAGVAGQTWVNGNNAFFQGSAGTVSVTAGGITVGNSTFNTSGYLLQGGPITLNGSAGFSTNGNSSNGIITLTINSSLEGSLGAKYQGQGISYNNFNISGANNYSGLTQVVESTLNYTTLAYTGFNSSFGTSGIVDVGGASSAVLIANVGAGGQTDRLWQNVGTSTTTEIYNNGTGPINFYNTSTAVAGALGVRGFIFGGTASTSIVNSFAEAINDLGTAANTTKVTVSGGTWQMSGASNYSGGTLLSGGILQVDSAENAGVTGPLGSGGNINFSGGTLQYSAANNFDYSARIATGTSTKAVIIDTNGQSITFATGLTSLQSGGLTKLGTGTLTLSAADAYTGVTSINAGTLALTNASAVPSTSVVNFTDTLGPATLDITGLNETVAGLGFGTQLNSSNNIVTIQGNSATSLTTSPTTLTFAPQNSAGILTVNMSSIGAFTYANTAGTVSVNLGSSNNSSTLGGNTTVFLASLTDSITAGTLNVGNLGSGVPGVGPTSTLVLGANTTLDINSINVGTSGSRSSGHLNAGSGTLTIAGTTGGSSTANLLIGKNDSYEAADIETSVFDTSAGTLSAAFGTMTIGEANPTGNQTASRGITINAIMNMGAGTLTANSLVLGTILNATNNSNGSFYQEIVTGSFNITGGTATIPTITFGTSAYTGNFNSTYGSVINANVVLNGGATLNATTLAPGAFNTPSQGTVTLNPTIVWNSGTIANIAGNGLSITGININVSGGAASHAFNISSGQTGIIASVISGTGGVNVIGAGSLLLNATSSYFGPTNISAGTVVSGVANALSPNSTINIIGGNLNASGNVNTIGGLNVASGVLDLGVGNTLTVNGVATLGGTLNLLGTVSTVPLLLMTYTSESGTFTYTPPAGDTLFYGGSDLVLESSSSTNMPSTLTWNNSGGSPSDGVTWSATSNLLNWNNGTSPTTYNDYSNNGSSGDIVSFTDANNGNYNVSITSLVHPTSVTVNNSLGAYTFNGSGGIAGPGGLTKLGSMSLTLATVNSYTGGTNVSGGLLIVGVAGALPAGGSLTIGSSGSVKVNNLSTLVTLGSLSNSGLLDLGNNNMVVHNGSLGTLFTEVNAGFNGGAWNGATGITSSVAAGDTTHLTALGIIQNSVDQTTTGTVLHSTFEGKSAVDSDVLIKYTYYGDANLDGKVDGSDYSLIDNGYLKTLTGWYNGDFNYDGVVNGSDYTLIDNAFNSQGTQISAEIASPSAVATAQIAGGSSAAVPEPATLSLLSVGGVGLLGRRRRRI